jgi:hypothetical protein
LRKNFFVEDSFSEIRKRAIKDIRRKNYPEK